MGVLGDSWCFCAGAGRSERMKASIFSGRGPAMAAVAGGAGFLIQRSLMLTAHVNLPSVAAAEAAADVRLQDRVPARLVPHRFFITSPVLDLTIVGLDAVDSDSTSQSQQPHYLKACNNPRLNHGSVVYLLGYNEKGELTVGEGKVVIATDNLIKLSTDGAAWCPGSAGFDVQGNLAFMVCGPMKLVSSPTAKTPSTSTSSSSSSLRNDLPMQFGIPIPVIWDWLNQNWEGSLDDVAKPKLPLIRLMPTGQKSDHSCASFTLRRIFKLEEGESDDSSFSSQISRSMHQPNLRCTALTNICQEGNILSEVHCSHEQGISTPEIHEYPLLTSSLAREEGTHHPILDINFPPRVPRSAAQPLEIKHLLLDLEENLAERHALQNHRRQDSLQEEMGSFNPISDDEHMAVRSVTGENNCELNSCPSPAEVSELEEGGRVYEFHPSCSSGGETMYSAETMESRNYTSPREDRFHQVGRSQSCMNYSRWSTSLRNPASHRGSLDKQRSLLRERRAQSQAAASQKAKGPVYFSPTVSSIMKKKNGSDQPPRSCRNIIQVSPRWV